MAEVSDSDVHSIPLSRLFVFSLSFIAFCGLFAVSPLSAWVGPTQPPPNGNVPAPVNVGTMSQIKDGSLGLKSLAVFGHTLFFSGGAITYTNYGSTSGGGGYGIRDNNGVMEYRDRGGMWTSFSSLRGAPSPTKPPAPLPSPPPSPTSSPPKPRLRFGLEQQYAHQNVCPDGTVVTGVVDNGCVPGLDSCVPDFSIMCRKVFIE